MKIASIADVKAHLSAFVNASEEELVVITENGKPVAVLLPMDDDEELKRLALVYSRRFQSILSEAREQIRTHGGIPHDDFWREMEAGTADKPPDRTMPREIGWKPSAHFQRCDRCSRSNALSYT